MILDNSDSNQRQRSRQKDIHQKRISQSNSPKRYHKDFDKDQYKQINKNQKFIQISKQIRGQLTEKEYLAKQQQFHQNQQLIRSFLRIQQGRQQPIDKFVKMIYTYKGKLKLDHKLLEIMKQPKKYLNKLTKNQLEQMLPETQIHLKAQNSSIQGQKYIQFWISLIDLIKYKIYKKSQEKSIISKQFKTQIRQMLNKSIPQLSKLQQTIILTLKNPGFNTNMQYWKNILQKIKAKKIQNQLLKYYQQFKQTHIESVNKQQSNESQQQFINTSPILTPIGNQEKNISTQQQQRHYRDMLAQKIFKQQFQKCREKLQVNLSLPKNHKLLSTNFIAQSTSTYDFISKEILEFQKYKRLQEDQEEFDDWVPTETQGRFRDRKPIYLNRVRVSYEWNKYNQTHFTDDNPPPKTIQGYKFNIFYPDLYDKQKTPQYYLENMQNPDFCLIKFKAGPPYKDIAFKIVKKEWDFSQKSGFESIFAKGILHLYFNFKKPRYRI